MSNFKSNPRYNVISLRINDQEKAAIEEMSQRTCKSISQIMLEAVKIYTRSDSSLKCSLRK